MSKEKYFIIYNCDGNTTIECITKEELLIRVTEEYGDIGYMKEIPINSDTNYWGNNLIIIKGEIVCPKPKEKIVEFDID